MSNTLGPHEKERVRGHCVLFEDKGLVALSSDFGTIKRFVAEDGLFMYIAAGSSNGRTSGFGPEYLGSSPSPAAMYRNVDPFASSDPQCLSTSFLILTALSQIHSI